MMSSGAETFIEQARRTQILQAAIDTVNELGYPRASLSAIAQRAGVAKSAISYYFKSKDALLMALVERFFSAFDTLLEEAIASYADPAERLRRYAEAYLRYVDANRAEVVAAIEIVVSHRGPDGVPIYLTATVEDSASLAAILADGMAQGTFRQMPVHIAVSLVEAILDVPTTELQKDLEADLTVLGSEVVKTIFLGLAPDTGQVGEAPQAPDTKTS